MYEDEIMDANVEAPVYQDETLVCKECGNEFVFTAGEQAFYAEKGFQKNAGKPERQYFEATCSECGGVAKLTFQPSTDRPVYCSACFEARRRDR